MSKEKKKKTSFTEKKSTHDLHQSLPINYLFIFTGRIEIFQLTKLSWFQTSTHDMKITIECRVLISAGKWKHKEHNKTSLKLLNRAMPVTI